MYGKHESTNSLKRVIFKFSLISFLNVFYTSYCHTSRQTQETGFIVILSFSAIKHDTLQRQPPTNNDY